MTKQQARLRVRLYARLSKDDGDADKESNSITNQLQMLRYYSKEKGFEIIDEYVDDGYSGTTFNRPDLNRMIEDAMEDTQPSGIMVKDMSRFGRNNAMFMYYVEEIFPNNDILFIALNDDVDTRFDENEMMPFKSIMNEYYARDTSKKIRSVKKTTALSGSAVHLHLMVMWWTQRTKESYWLILIQHLLSNEFLNYRNRATAFIRLREPCARMVF